MRKEKIFLALLHVCFIDKVAQHWDGATWTCSGELGVSKGRLALGNRFFMLSSYPFAADLSSSLPLSVSSLAEMDKGCMREPGRRCRASMDMARGWE